MQTAGRRFIFRHQPESCRKRLLGLLQLPHSLVQISRLLCPACRILTCTSIIITFFLQRHIVSLQCLAEFLSSPLVVALLVQCCAKIEMHGRIAAVLCQLALIQLGSFLVVPGLKQRAALIRLNNWRGAKDQQQSCRCLTLLLPSSACCGDEGQAQRMAAAYQQKFQAEQQHCRSQRPLKAFNWHFLCALAALRLGNQGQLAFPHRVKPLAHVAERHIAAAGFFRNGGEHGFIQL